MRWAAVGAAAGALASRCWLSGTPWKLERAPAWGPPAVVNCLMASAVRDSPLPLSRWGGDGQLTIGGLKVLRPAPGRRRARRCVCARHAVGARGAVVGGSPWSATGRAALLEPPAAAAAAAVHCPGNLLELWSKRGPANPRREGALLSRHEGVHQHTKTFWAGRRGSRADAAKQRGTYPGGAAKSTTTAC